MKRHTVQQHLILSFSLLFLSVLNIICIVVIWRSFFLQKEQYEEATQGISTQVALTLDTYFYEIENLVISTSTSKELLANWKVSHTLDPYSSLCTRQEIKDYFRTVLQSRTDIANIAIFDDERYIGSDNFKEIGITNDYLNQIWADYQNDQSFKTHYYGLHTLNYQMRPSTEGYPEVITIAYPVRDFNHLSSENEALLIFDIYYATFQKQISRIDSLDAITILVDETNCVVYSTSSEYPSGTRFYALDGNEFPGYLWTNTVLASNNWNVIVLQPFSVLNDATLRTILIIVILFIIVFFIILIFISAISKQIAAPIVSLSHSMTGVDLDHNEAIAIPANGNNVPSEINLLYAKYNELLARIASLKMEAYEATIKQKEANYLALQSQVNPHFLNNVLQTIQSLAVLKKSEEIQFVTSSMGDWLEYTLYANSDFVTVSEEINYVTKYLQLYRYRLGENFRYNIHIDDEVSNFVIPRFIIQPLVENAVLHGLSDVDNKQLSIEGQLLEDKVFLSVQDNGVGIESESLQAIIDGLDSNSTSPPSIGLCNVNQRIKAIYGSAYGLELQSQPGFGTCATLIFPISIRSD